jgi:hypothetical protein
VPDGDTLEVLVFDAATGKPKWSVKAARNDTIQWVEDRLVLRRDRDVVVHHASGKQIYTSPKIFGGMNFGILGRDKRLFVSTTDENGTFQVVAMASRSRRTCDAV